MKFLRFAITFLITLALTIALNFRITSIPPLGKLLDPFHGFWQNAQSKAIDAPKVVDLPGMKDAVTVKYDEDLIPHIFAQNEEDLYEAVGYITASQRLWQMEFETHDAAGRLSEIVGPLTLKRDRLKRRQGMVQWAELDLKHWEQNDTINRILDAYTAGVNAYINSLGKKDYPIEYKLLDYKPEPWTKLKCVLLLKYMSAMLTMSESDLENTNTVKLFGKKDFDFLFPEKLPGIDPVIPAGTKWDFDPIKIERPDSTDQLFLFTNNVTEKPDPAIGSNNWAVSGTKTKSGYPIFANDMHLGLNLPCIWFQMQLNTPKFNVFGHNLPGVPFIITGFNDSIAWGFTNAYRDMVDWYKITYRTNSRDQYKYNDKWMNTRKVIEAIKVRGEGTFYDTVVYTHHGPVVYDRNFTGNDQQVDLAMHWIASVVSDEPLTFLELPKARNYDSFKKAIRHFACPPQNMAFASAQGDIAMNIQGKFPNKWREQGKFILDGSSREADWQGYIPVEQNPSILNPERGFVSSCNQNPTDSLYPYYTYCDHFEHYRNVRLNRVLDSLQNIDVQDMMHLQMDDYSVMAESIMPTLLDSLVTENLNGKSKEIAEALMGWNYQFDYDQKAPSYFRIWWRLFYNMIWDEFDNQKVALDKPNNFTTIYILKKYPNYKFIDIKSTPQKETLTDLINLSFAEAVDSIEQWEKDKGLEITWQHFKNTGIRHMVPFFTSFSYEDLAIGGDATAINAVTTNHGPSQRLIVSLGPAVKAWSNYAGGQSGNPGNPQYDHFIDAWTKGKYFPVLFLHSPTEQNDKIIFTQTLTKETK